jgi:hypothetical protein
VGWYKNRLSRGGRACFDEKSGKTGFDLYKPSQRALINCKLIAKSTIGREATIVAHH